MTAGDRGTKNEGTAGDGVGWPGMVNDGGTADEL